MADDGGGIYLKKSDFINIGLFVILYNLGRPRLLVVRLSKDNMPSPIW